jgi:hypothetical protein
MTEKLKIATNIIKVHTKYTNFLRQKNHSRILAVRTRPISGTNPALKTPQ